MATQSTTVQTTVSQTEDCGVAKNFTDAELQTVVGEILDADVKMEHFCPKHHLLLAVNASTLMTRCNQCNKTSKTTVEFQISVKVKSAQQKINLDNVQIRELLSVKDEQSVDAHSLVADILVHDEMHIQTWRDFLTKVSFVERSGSSSAGTSLTMKDTAGRSTEDSVFELEGEEAVALEGLFDEGE